MASPCESCVRSSLSTCPEERMQPSRDWLCNKMWASTSRGASHKPATETDRRSESPKAQDLESLSQGGGGRVMGGGLCEGVSGGGFTPGGFFDSSRRIFRRMFLADFSFAFCDQKNPPQNPPQNPPFVWTVTFQGGSFQEKTPGLIGPRNLRILIGRIAVGWPCMECHVPCHISTYWVWDSVKQSKGWGRNTALIARSPTRHSKSFIETFHHKSSLLVLLLNKFALTKSKR